jgi:hypothetical protein
MIVVIQCAAKKWADAGFLRTSDGRSVSFVAQPDEAPPDRSRVYARPGDPADNGTSWRVVFFGGKDYLPLFLWTDAIYPGEEDRVLQFFAATPGARLFTRQISHDDTNELLLRMRWRFSPRLCRKRDSHMTGSAKQRFASPIVNLGLSICNGIERLRHGAYSEFSPPLYLS